MEYKRMTKLSDLGTLHALDFNGEEQPLCELTALDTDVLIRRLYELENKIESGELGDVKELKQELKEQKYWREVAERAFSKLVHEMYEHDIRPMCDEKFFIESRLKDAEKELAEERT